MLALYPWRRCRTGCADRFARRLPVRHSSSALEQFAVLLLAVGGGSAQAATTCSDFSTQQEAQDALADNPGLDRDKDGVACEELANNSSSSSSSSGSTSVVTQADCNAGRITRNGHTLSSADCERLIGQRVNLAGTGFEAWLLVAGGALLLLIAAGATLHGRRRRLSPSG